MKTKGKFAALLGLTGKPPKSVLAPCSKKALNTLNLCAAMTDPGLFRHGCVSRTSRVKKGMATDCAVVVSKQFFVLVSSQQEELGRA